MVWDGLQEKNQIKTLHRTPCIYIINMSALSNMVASYQVWCSLSRIACLSKQIACVDFRQNRQFETVLEVKFLRTIIIIINLNSWHWALKESTLKHTYHCYLLFSRCERVLSE